MSATIIDGKIVHYEVLGRGKPIILLHTWVGSWRYWIPTMQAVSASYRAYAIDLWGFGESAKASNSYNPKRQADLVSAFIHAMGIGKVALLGHGIGAAVALLFMNKHPDMIERAMLVSPPPAAGGLARFFDPAFPTELADLLLGESPGADEARSDAAKTDPAAIHVSLQALEAFDLPTLSKTIPTPSLIVSGGRDPMITGIQSFANGDLPAMCHQIDFPDSGHYPMLDHPNKFNRLVQDFLDLPPNQSPRQLQLKEEWKRRVR